MKIMKRNLLIIAAIASVTLVSCSSEEFTGEGTNPTPNNESRAIMFSSGTGAITRADLYGSAAAEKLGGKFVVYGTKHAAAEDETATNDAVVYDNFLVKWASGTAGTTASNSSDWEYVGETAYSSDVTSAQAIKYWDYSTVGYTFSAFSYHPETGTAFTYPAAKTTDEVYVEKVTTDATSLYNKGYAVTVNPDATLNNLYFSDRMPVAKADYDKIVNLTFRNIGAKVRVGFYETIPGYSVKIKNFYIDDDATAAVTTFPAMNVAKTDGFYASLQNVDKTVAQTLNVTYYDNTDATIENRPKMTNPSAGYKYALNLGNAAGIINKELGTSSSAPTWVDGTTGDYTPVFPFEGNTNPLFLKLDFTMTAEDGTDEVIEVKGARAIVPAQYVQWKSNFAYTYIFKISDKTNGTTGKVDGNGDPIEDPEGLKPITFDAVVVDIAEELQQTITSVSTRSITTYAEGAIVNEYKVGKPIYTVISTKSTGGVITPTAIGNAAKNAQVYRLMKADNSDAPASEAEVFAQLTGAKMDLRLIGLTTPAATIEDNVPLVDGTNPAIKNVKFTPSAAGTYAYVYTTTAYVAPTYAAATTYDSGTTYYMKSSNDLFYAVSVPTEAAFTANKASLYIQTDAGTPGEYDIKVIKVQE